MLELVFTTTIREASNGKFEYSAKADCKNIKDETCNEKEDKALQRVANEYCKVLSREFGAPVAAIEKNHDGIDRGGPVLNIESITKAAEKTTESGEKFGINDWIGEIVRKHYIPDPHEGGEGISQLWDGKWRLPKWGCDTLASLVDELNEIEPRVLKDAAMASFLAGMELSMRICRNRAKDEKEKLDYEPDSSFLPEAENCAGMIRIVQVEIGSGRSPLPHLTKDEIEELDRIS